MIKSVSVKNFRGQTRTYDLDFKSASLVGRNEAGKTTLREAICFGFTSLDSTGYRCPLHLISTGEHSCEVVIETSKAKLTRTLTQKKSASFKIEQGGFVRELSQTDMEAKIGSTDLFLSVFVPGYFLSMDAQKKLKVLSEVTPKADRFEIWEKIAGTSLTEDEREAYDPTKRSDLVASKIATDRRNLQRQFDEDRGWLLHHGQEVQTPQKPEKPDLDKLTYLEGLARSWDAYRNQSAVYEAESKSRNQALEYNAKRRDKKAFLEEQLSMLSPERSDAQRNEEIRVRKSRLMHLINEFLAVPSAPNVTDINFENCHTCGQTVGIKHREKVRKQNERILAEASNAFDEIIAHNAKLTMEKVALQGEIDQLVLLDSEDKEHNRKVHLAKMQLELEIKGLTELNVPAEPEAPRIPDEFDVELLQTLRAQQQGWVRANATYESEVARQAGLASKAAAVEQRLAAGDQLIKRLELLEESVKKIPGVEMQMKSESLAIPGYALEVGDDIQLFRADGTPYKLLSAGAQIRAEVALCQKLNSLARVPLGIIFIDNADLMDVQPEANGTQTFRAHVVGDKELTIIKD